MGRIFKAVILFGMVIQMTLPQAAVAQDYYDNSNDNLLGILGAAGIGALLGFGLSELIDDSEPVSHGYYRDRRDIQCRKERVRTNRRRSKLVTVCKIRGKWQVVENRNYIATRRFQRRERLDLGRQHRGPVYRQPRFDQNDFLTVQPRRQFGNNGMPPAVVGPNQGHGNQFNQGAPSIIYPQAAQ